MMGVPDEVKKLIDGSGNTFHAKVARWLVDNDWHVVVSPYYLDQSQGKAREIDLVAERLWTFYDPFGQPAGEIAVRLFIECKYVPSSAVFWFADKDLAAAEELVCSGTPFRSDNSFTQKHHYLSRCPRVAKLFTSKPKKASENEPFYKALNQALNGMVSLRGQSASISTATKFRRGPAAILEFPIVICNSFSSIYTTSFDIDDEPKLLEENFQLEVRYAYVDRNQAPRDDYFLLDFVEFDRLGEFMEWIAEDAKSAAHLVS